MRMIKRFPGALVAATLLVAAAAAPAVAGPVTIRPPDGGRVEVSVTYKDASTAFVRTTVDDGPLDEDKRPGYFTITVPNQANAKTIDVKSLGAIFPAAAFNHLDFGAAGLLSFEPIDLFQFTSNDLGTILLAVMDVPQFMAHGDPFSEGEIFDISNGLAAGTQGLEFRDATGLFGSVDSFFDVFVELDPTTINTLPLYTGQATVNRALQFRVAEPGTLLLAGFILLALVRPGRRQGLRRTDRS